MSRIHDILSKAERDGTARRVSTAGLTATEDAPPPVIEPAARIMVLHDDAASDAFPVGRHGTVSALVETAPATPDIRGVQLDPVLVAALEPESLASEQYRTLRTRITQSENGRAVRTIAVTSPAKGDGKSVNAANLALTMAQEFQQRIVLVDGDLRHPRVHHLLGLTAGVGLAEVLKGELELDAALVSLPDHHLTVLPAGVPPSHPAELLGSTAMRRVIESLRQRYDRIVIDMPPAAPLADAQILSPLVDGVVVIVRAGVTPRPAIERTLGGFDRVKVLGLVLNEAGVSTESGYSPEGYRKD